MWINTHAQIHIQIRRIFSFFPIFIIVVHNTPETNLNQYYAIGKLPLSTCEWTATKNEIKQNKKKIKTKRSDEEDEEREGKNAKSKYRQKTRHSRNTSLSHTQQAVNIASVCDMCLKWSSVAVLTFA